MRCAKESAGGLCCDSTVGDVYCSGAGAKPATQQACQGVTSCGYSWNIGDWSACSDPVNGGYQTRDVYCRRSDGSVVADAYCGAKPNTVMKCEPQGKFVWKNYTTCDTTGRRISDCKIAGYGNHTTTSSDTCTTYSFRGMDWESGGSGNGPGSGWKYAQIQVCQYCTGSGCKSDTLTKEQHVKTCGTPLGLEDAEFCGFSPSLFTGQQCGINAAVNGQYVKKIRKGVVQGGSYIDIGVCTSNWQ